MTLFKKYYAAELYRTDTRHLLGSKFWSVPFWFSAKKVYTRMRGSAPNGYTIINFRRVE